MSRNSPSVTHWSWLSSDAPSNTCWSNFIEKSSVMWLASNTKLGSQSKKSFSIWKAIKTFLQCSIVFLPFAQTFSLVSSKKNATTIVNSSILSSLKSSTLYRTTLEVLRLSIFLWRFFIKLCTMMCLRKSKCWRIHGWSSFSSQLPHRMITWKLMNSNTMEPQSFSTFIAKSGPLEFWWDLYKNMRKPIFLAIPFKTLSFHNSGIKIMLKLLSMPSFISSQSLRLEKSGISSSRLFKAGLMTNPTKWSILRQTSNINCFYLLWLWLQRTRNLLNKM